MKILAEFAPAKDNPRNSEGAFYRRWDGKIGFVYSRFTQGREDFSRSDLVEAVIGEDGTGLTGDTRVLFTTEQFAAQNIMCPSLLTLPDGRLLLFVMVRMGPGHMNPWLYESRDGGKSFENGREILPGKRYTVAENDRAVLTSKGSLLLWLTDALANPNCYAGVDPHCAVCCMRSTDGGKTFTLSERYDFAASYSGLQEPGAAELPDGSLLVWARTDAGCQFLSRSYDDGISCAPFTPSPVFTSPLSPMSVRRLSDGRYLAVYNPDPTAPGAPLWLSRSPLVYRLSRDGLNWSDPVLLEPKSETTNYCYTGIFPEKDYVLLAYCASDTVRDGGNLSRLRITRLEMGELNEKRRCEKSRAVL